MLPVTLNIAGRLAVVVGGGPVGRRKAYAVLAAGGRVRLVCREARYPEADPRVEWLTADYAPAHLDGAALAFAAATADVNARVVADAQARGVWACDSAEPGRGDFTLPAVLRRGPFTVAVGTGGAAPALARNVRDELAAAYDRSFGDWVALLAEMRPVVLAEVPEPGRREVFDRLADPLWLDRLRENGLNRTREDMLTAVGQAQGR